MWRNLLLFLICTPALAQEEPQKDSIAQLDEVIVSDTLLTKSTLGITPSEIIGPQTFQNYGPLEITPILNQTAGIFAFAGALNTNRITIRGIGARTPYGTNKLRLYFDGIPVTDGSGFSTLEAYDLENLAEIEVVKGPKGTAYGANLGGSILLKTKNTQVPGTRMSNTTSLGSYGMFKDNLAVEHQDDKFRLALHYGHLSTEGYRKNSEFDRNGILLNTQYQLNADNQLGLIINHIDYSAAIASSLGETDFKENPEKAAYTWGASQGYEDNKYTLVGLNYKHAFSKDFSNTTSLYYSYLDHYEARPFGILDEFTNSYGLRTQFDGQYAKGSFAFGGEVYQDAYHWNEYENLDEQYPGEGSVEGDVFADNREYRKQWFLFGSFSYVPIPDLIIQLGLNLNKTHYDYKDDYNSGAQNKSATRNFDAILLPNLNVQYNFSSQFQLYANISRGFSNPSLEETLTPEGVINPDIAQEKGMNYEVGSSLTLFEALQLKVALYQMEVENLLVAERAGDDQYVGRNAGKTRHKGLELEMNYIWEPLTTFRLNPFVNYTYNQHNFVSFVDGGNDYSGNPLTGVPDQLLTAGLQTQFLTNFYWNWVYQFVGEIPMTDANTLSSDPYSLVNTRMGYRQALGKQLSIGVAFGINNVLDKHYARSVLINAQGFGGQEPRYYYPGEPRNYYGGLQLGYQF